MSSMDSSGASEHRNKLIAAAALILVAGVVYVYANSGGERVITSENAKAFYTVDEGATTFVDTADKITPFDHNGKPAVEAIVFTGKAGSGQVVGYLKRLSPEAKKRAESEAKTALPASASEVKLPNAPTWVSLASAEGMKIVQQVRQTNDQAEQVIP